VNKPKPDPQTTRAELLQSKIAANELILESQQQVLESQLSLIETQAILRKVTAMVNEAMEDGNCRCEGVQKIIEDGKE